MDPRARQLPGSRLHRPELRPRTAAGAGRSHGGSLPPAPRRARRAARRGRGGQGRQGGGGGPDAAAAFLDLPGDLFHARSSLERLALGRLSLRAVTLPAAGLAGLRSLSLSHTDVTDEALRGVLGTCRALESLSLRCCPLLAAVRVASERLRALELLGCRAVRELRVAAPALESFALYGDVILSTADWCESVAVDFAAAPALRDVYLSHMVGFDTLDRNHDHYYPFVYHVPQARILTLCSVGLVVPLLSRDSDDDDRFDHLPYA